MENLSVLISMLISNSSHTILERKNSPTHFHVFHYEESFPVKYESGGYKWEAALDQVK